MVSVFELRPQGFLIVVAKSLLRFILAVLILGVAKPKEERMYAGQSNFGVELSEAELAFVVGGQQLQCTIGGGSNKCSCPEGAVMVKEKTENGVRLSC